VNSRPFSAKIRRAVNDTADFCNEAIFLSAMNCLHENQHPRPAYTPPATICIWVCADTCERNPALESMGQDFVYVGRPGKKRSIRNPPHSCRGGFLVN
jgi:hypothetical protein